MQEIPLHTVMRITYDGWNPPREVCAHMARGPRTYTYAYAYAYMHTAHIRTHVHACTYHVCICMSTCHVHMFKCTYMPYARTPAALPPLCTRVCTNACNPILPQERFFLGPNPDELQEDGQHSL